MRVIQFLNFLLWVAWASAQTQTVPDAAGATVVEVLTTDARGAAATSILSTLSPSTTTNSLLNQLTQTTATATTSTPAGGGGVVEQPASEALTPGGPTPYTYTTTNALGETVTMEGIFTPTGPATVLPTPTTTGTILNYSSWLAMVGTNTVAANAAGRISLSIATGWYCLVVMVMTGLASGTWIVIS
ncbi:hypothetical protein F5J12DRAFT_810535 [Pisolithus orientalis]|uniref:uncharacterized protein n=1 Tax=Pisolithus orientalis TaxID=936130 RepID=UPI002224FD1A|nr:uncharacterized protein F5J12DRAFT_810535 [Pisolithus orientalis]KAI6025815.1 hypothetical protein F5J12DRAFT_810535 [Pisolithus orientalis]KAI6155332.1 hypothetical protein BKA82DRAFT_4077363 [Pisolithus tinctorius]